jgi:RNA polymerase sigma-70 factor (ECF subfamily)
VIAVLMQVVKEYRVPEAGKSETAELTQRFSAGDERAFNDVVALYQHRLIKSAQAILGDEHEAMDMVQEMFIKAYFHRTSFRGDSALYTWLYRILYNICISALRRKKILTLISVDNEEETIEPPSDEPGPLDVVTRNEIRAIIDKALKQVPPRQRMVFVMKQIDGLKHNEIAEIMNISEGAVKASYFHAIKKLREILSDYGGEYGLC